MVRPTCLPQDTRESSFHRLGRTYHMHVLRAEPDRSNLGEWLGRCSPESALRLNALEARLTRGCGN